VTNRIRNLVQFIVSQPRIMAAVSFVVGLLLGWWLLGWWLFPVQWIDALPTDLEASYREDYLAMVADSYARNGDVNLALVRLRGFDAATVERVARRLDQQGFAEQATQLRSRAREKVQPPQAGATPAPTVRPVPTAPTGAGAPSPADRLRFTCGALLLAALLLVGGVLFARYLQQVRGRQPMGGPPQPSAATFGRPVQEVSLGQTVRVDYQAGQPEYAKEFVVYDAHHTRLGSWALQVPRYLSSAEQANTAVLELWLTDQRTGQVERKALFGRRAFLDEATRTAYRPSGTAVQIQTGSVIHLDAGGLHLEATVLDVVYDHTSTSLGNSRLERLNLEVMVVLTTYTQPINTSPEDESSGPSFTDN
jgi:hypothetical protein